MTNDQRRLLSPNREPRPRKRYRLDLLCACGAQRDRGCAEGGAGGKDVVDQDQAEPVCTGGAKGTCNVSLARLGSEGRLGPGLPHPAQEIAPHRPTDEPAQRSRNPLALIVPPLPQPALAEGDRYQAYLPGQWLELTHCRCHPLGNPPPAGILQQMHRILSGALKPNGAADPRQFRRPLDADPAFQPSSGRLSTALAVRRGNRPPARAANGTNQRILAARRSRLAAEQAGRRKQPALQLMESSGPASQELFGQVTGERHRPRPALSPRELVHRGTTAPTPPLPAPPAWSGHRRYGVPPTAWRGPKRSRRGRKPDRGRPPSPVPAPE